MVKTLTLDIETTPMVKYSWSLHSDYGSIDQIIERPRILCVAAKWADKRGTMFASEWGDGDLMLHNVSEWLDEADIVQGWNSDGFDLKWINGQLVSAGIPLPSPYKSVDLMKVAKRNLRLPSYKLDYVANLLVGESKNSTGGFKLWKDIIEPTDERVKLAAWRKMERYNRRDVVITEKVAQQLSVLNFKTPHVGLYDEEVGLCPHCNSDNARPRGFALTSTRKYQRYRCEDCSRWFRSSRSVESAETVAL